MIPAVASVTAALPVASSSPAITPTTGTGGDFGSMLSNLLGSLSQTEQTSNQLISKAATGGNVDLHDVTIAMQTESLAFDVATQVRNKVLEAYSDVFKTQNLVMASLLSIAPLPPQATSTPQNGIASNAQSSSADQPSPSSSDFAGLLNQAVGGGTGHAPPRSVRKHSASNDQNAALALASAGSGSPPHPPTLAWQYGSGEAGGTTAKDPSSEPARSPFADASAISAHLGSLLRDGALRSMSAADGPIHPTHKEAEVPQPSTPGTLVGGRSAAGGDAQLLERSGVPTTALVQGMVPSGDSNATVASALAHASKKGDSTSALKGLDNPPSELSGPIPSARGGRASVQASGANSQGSQDGSRQQQGSAGPGAGPLGIAPPTGWTVTNASDNVPTANVGGANAASAPARSGPSLPSSSGTQLSPDAADGGPLDPRLVLGSVSRAVVEQAQRGRSTATVTLNPPSLGKLTVRFDSGENGLVIRLAADQGDVANLLRTHLGDLQQALVGRDIQVSELHVLPNAPQQSGDQTAWNQPRQGQRQAGEGAPQDRGSSANSDDNPE